MQKEWVEGASERVRGAMIRIAGRCGGLPVALGVARNGIRNIAREKGGDDVGERERRMEVLLSALSQDRMTGLSVFGAGQVASKSGNLYAVTRGTCIRWQ